ncbi:LEA family epithelial adhesin [Lactobacillus crispatus]|uniref:LEA family epithelial adhesin n=2 Tax=Lactobacillus crispatus TaxID=47770 RepID=UPI001303364C|nr:LEA family epithelial adhesin [Lactobacillus crispatus]QGY94191.1 LEA family epithelial adhesin [Lactobacillus crispatus]
MKRLKFLETKRTPRYSLRKFSVGVASVLLGVTIFGINFTNHSVKAATTESVDNSSANSRLQQTSAAVLTTAEQTNTQQATSATETVQQTSASNNATANNSKEAATTPQSSPETQGSADTDINSSAAKLAATVDQNNTNTQEATSATETVRQGSASKNATANNSAEAATTSQSLPKTKGSAHTYIRSLAAKNLLAMNLLALPDTDGNAEGTSDTDGNATGTSGTDTGTDKDRSAAVTVNPDNINTQPAKENQKLANEHNLSSSDNYSSNIYQGTDGKYYKIITIYGNDYVYHAADIQANGDDTTAEDTKNNINISKEDLGNGKTRWTVVFFPHKGLQNVGSNLSGLSSAKFGIALTNDYQILGNVDMDVISDPKQTFSTYIFKHGSNRATETTVQNPPAEVKFSFNPKTDVDENTGLINSKTMPAYNNKYLQGPYYFTTATDTGKKNLWQTYFKKWGVFSNGSNNAYDGSPYLGNDHELHFSDFNIRNKTGVDGAKQGDLVIYDKLGYDNFNGKLNSDGVFSSYNFNQAMEFKSQGVTNQAQFSSYVVSFTTQHTDSYEVNLDKGPKNQQFSGISANIYSYQNGHYNMFSSLYGEQRALNAAGVAKQANEVVSGWGPAKEALGQIKQDYLNNAQINVLRNKILNNITDSDAVNNIIKEGNSLNDAMKNLGNSIGQYDPDGSFAGHKEDTTKASDRYKYANPDKQEAYDNATEVTKALINKDTGTYADKATVEKLTEAENKAWNELNGVVNAAKNAIDQAAKTKNDAIDGSNLTDEEKAGLHQQVTDEVNKAKAAIDDAKKDSDVTTAKNNGVEKINNINVPDTSATKEAAKNAIDQAAKTKNDAIDGSNLTDEEKAGLHQQVTDEVNKAKAAIDDAKKDSDVTTAKNNGVEKINNINVPDTSATKDDANKATDAGNITPNVPGDKATVKDPSHLTDDEKNQVKNNVDNANKDKFPDGTKVEVGDDGTATVTYPDGSKDTIPGDQLVQGQKGSTTDAGNITPTVPGGKVTVKDPSHLTDDEKNQVKNNVDNANKDNFPDGTEITVGDDGTTTVTYPDGSQDTIPGDQLVQGQKGDTTDAGNITPTVPGGKVTVKDPSHLTDSEKDQVKKNVEDANKDNFPDGTEITVGDDGTATVTYPDGSKDVIAGTDLIIAAKGEDVPGSKYHSHKNGSNSSQADRVKGASTANGSIANAGNNLGVKAESDNAFVGVKGESDNAIGNNKATSLKTLPQTGTKDTSILGVLGMLLASLGLFGFKKKRDKE